MNEAIDRIREAALANDAQAQWDLAVCYAQGNGVEQSGAKAFEWVCRAAENGHAGAADYVIDAYENGKEELGIQPDLDKLVEWADKLSENGCAAMRIKYAQLACNDATCKKVNISTAFERVAEFADKGNLLCMFCAAILGQTIGERNLKNSIYDCAHMNRVIKYVNMLDGTKYEIPEEEKASYWYDYGAILQNAKKKAESLYWFKKAIPYSVSAEMAFALFSFAYHSQKGTPLSSSDYVEVYNHAINALKRTDYKITVGWEIEAYLLLAILTREGAGTPVDIDASYDWTVRAANLGSEDAKRDLPRYHKKLFGGYTFK